MRKTIFTLVSIFILTSSMATIVPKPLTTDPDPVVAKAKFMESLVAWKNAPRKEKKVRLKQAKKELKAFKEARKAGKEGSTNTVLLVILALLLPPLAVYLHQGATGKFWITLLLWGVGVVGLFSGFGWAITASVIYAVLVVLNVL